MSAIEFTEEEIARGAERATYPTFRIEDVTTKEDAKVLAKRIAKLHGIDADWMLGPTRLAHAAAARADFYKALRAQKWSFPAIGLVANRHHTTVMAALRGKS